MAPVDSPSRAASGHVIAIRASRFSGFMDPGTGAQEVPTYIDIYLYI
jgi:hypothetical protein